jgi:Na+-transporting NADH:ubiquinone oxidoreductase subunit F
MSEWNLIALGMFLFTLIVVLLVAVILFARSRLVAKGSVTLVINDDPQRSPKVPAGGKLLTVLAENGIYLPSACGGSGTCGQCRVIVKSGGGDLLDTERAKLSPAQVRRHYRLSCQLAVKQDMQLEIPPELLTIRKMDCTVRSNRSVATFIKELVLDLPPDEAFAFRAGGYILVEVPPHSLRYTEIEIDEHFRPAWDKFGLWRHVSTVEEPVTRAYSMANYPEERGIIMLNARIASPPPGHPEAPPGKASSYLFRLRPGDPLTVSGPYGQFFARDTDNEMIFVGGGSGMAPMRSHILDQLKRLCSKHTISFWYGARSLQEVFYREEFDALEQEYDNFRWTIGLSGPLPEDHWTGPTGFIHQILYDDYLKDHPAPEACDYYLCGPPMMIHAVQKMLHNLGVDSKNILFDDFGG